VCTGAGAPLEIFCATFEGIAVKLEASGRFGVVQSVHGTSCSVAVGSEHLENGIALPGPAERIPAET